MASNPYHWKFAFDAAFFPTANEGELALEYAFVFLLIACRCAGMTSIHAKREPHAAHTQPAANAFGRRSAVY